ADAPGEVAREPALPGPDLEDDVVRPELGEAADHLEDVRIAEEVLAVLLLHRPKHSSAFLSIAGRSAASSEEVAWARAARVWSTYAGSLRFPRTGCGARYGQSVSTSNLSSGTWLAATRRSVAFL